MPIRPCSRTEYFYSSECSAGESHLPRTGFGLDEKDRGRAACCYELKCVPPPVAQEITVPPGRYSGSGSAAALRILSGNGIASRRRSARRSREQSAGPSSRITLWKTLSAKRLSDDHARFPLNSFSEQPSSGVRNIHNRGREQRRDRRPPA